VFPVLAHQGGWDEALFVIVPLLVFWFLLRAAKRRAEAEQAEQAEQDQDAPLADEDG
jgi:cbb3-type cytochrome oxidase subunit 3